MTPSFILFFTAGIICVCILFASLLLFPSFFPLLMCLYFVATAGTLLHNVRKLQKEIKENQTLINLQYIHIFNIIIASFLSIITAIMLIPKPKYPY